MELILLAGHGSHEKSANNLDHVARLLHEIIHPECSRDCVRSAYLKFRDPDIMEAIKSCVRDGATRVVVHPYFLTDGTHVKRDIPSIIREAEERYPDVRFIYTEPLGVHNKMAQVVFERIHSASGIRPGEIEEKSFGMISDEADLSGIPAERRPVIKRVIHTTADFEFKSSLVFHPDAIEAGIRAIRAGREILTDVEMVRTGINKNTLKQWGGKVICSIPAPDDDRESEGSEKSRQTRSERGIEQALKDNTNIGIIAIGNAPTALLKVIEILNYTDTLSDQILVVGVPVGFVKALESKTLLASQDFPFITNISRKGGSTVAVAIVNALLKMAQDT